MIVRETQDEPLPAISMFILDAAPQMTLPRAKRESADSMMSRRPMIWDHKLCPSRSQKKEKHLG
jgi:hypothetical protein